MFSNTLQKIPNTEQISPSTKHSIPSTEQKHDSTMPNIHCTEQNIPTVGIFFSSSNSDIQGNFASTQSKIC